MKRHRKVLQDSIQRTTRRDIRRLARRDDVKRISARIYANVRDAIRDRLAAILNDCTKLLKYSQRKAITMFDVVIALRRREKINLRLR